MKKSQLITMLALFSVLGTVNAAPIFYETRTEFLDNVGTSITDDYTAYVPGTYTDASEKSSAHCDVYLN